MANLSYMFITQWVRKIMVWTIILTAIPGILQAQRGTPAAYPQGTQMNHIRIWDPVKPITDSAQLTLTTPVASARMTTQYFDGVGRSVQTVVKKGSLQTDPANPASAANAVDMVNAVVYDEFGREQFKYLGSPATATGGNPSVNDGLFKLNSFQQQEAFYNNGNASNPFKGQGEAFFYGQTVFEASPLNRVNKSLSPGNSWIGNNKGVENQYQVNAAGDSVRIWNVTDVPGSFGTYSTPASDAGIYPAGQLYKNISIDEHDKQVIEFKDKTGRVILKKVQLIATADNGTGSGHAGWLCTYYIYDELNNLRCVVQPSGVELLMANSWNMDALNGAILNEQCFRYEYDHRNRMIMKKVPGAGAVYMVYDLRDRLVMTQDANMRANQQWLATLYDELNRPVMTALVNYNGTLATLQQVVNQQTTPPSANIPYALPLTGVTSGLKQALNSITLEDGFVTPDGAEFTAEIVGSNTSVEGVVVNYNPIPAGASYIVLTKTGYDNYAGIPVESGLTGTIDNTFTGSDYMLASYNTPPDYAEQVVQSAQTKGLVTWTQTRVLGSSPAQFLYAVNIYDDKGRIVQVKSKNITGGSDVATTQYNFSGQPVVTVQKQQVSGVNTQTHVVVTRLAYDELSRLLSIKKKTGSSLINAGALPAEWTAIANNEYDALGQLKKKTLAGGLETLSYDYNIRGWLLGTNRDYLVDNATGSYFGFELGYDKTANKASRNFNQAQYNGNINGMVWKSKGDGIQRKYDFGYDAANRLLKGDFEQHNTDGNWNNSTVNFNVQLGDGSNPATAYDANGNIKAMSQWGLKVNASAPIDNLQYEYYGNSNKLKRVVDNQNDNNSKLGDFKYDAATKGAADYGYDLNGNLVTDQNKKLNGALGDAIDPTLGTGAIRYNHLNLPEQINVAGKGTITYKYDATGNKLSKTVIDNTSGNTTTTMYIAGFEYKNDTLQQLAQDEGRIRYAKKYFANGDSTYQFMYDYFLKDHLGNVRMVLTEQKDTSGYFATMETGAGNAIRNKENRLFANIDASAFDSANVPGGYPADNSLTNPNKYVARLNGSGQKIGPAIVLKVMSGDVIDLAVKSFYRSQGSSGGNANIFNDILTSLAGGIVTVAGETKGTLGDLSNSGTSPLLGPLSLFRSGNNPDPAGKPKAYLNWILLDEQFTYVGSYPQSGALPVGGPDVLNTLAYSGINVTKSGYLYIYVSNETENWDVFFDNLAIKHYTGPMLEETHYYPWGLTMAGISSKALKGKDCGCDVKKLYNSNELQNKEFSDGSGLELYDFNARTYDQQVGRFIQIDPVIENSNQENLSPYHFGGNNPIRYNDPDGKCPWCIGAIVGAAVDYASQVTANKLAGKSWSESLTEVDVKSIAISAVAGAASGGLSVVVPKGAAAKVVVAAAQTAVDAGESALKQLNENGTVSLKQTVTDVVVNKVAGTLTQGVEVNTGSTIKTTEKQLNRAQRVAAGDPSSSGRAVKVKQLSTKLAVQKGTNQAANQAASGAVSASIDGIGNLISGNHVLSQPVNYNLADNTAIKPQYIPEIKR